jgi:hypothetical protein
MSAAPFTVGAPMSAPSTTTGPPDFVGVGAQRSGTSWWFDLILSHPEVGPPRGRRKELHFFDRYGGEPLTAAAIAKYHDLFPREPGLICGEFTPRYMTDPWSCRLLRQAAPDTKVLVMLRDPIERYRSGIVHRRTVGRTDRRRAAIANEAIERGRYGSQLKRVYRAFPREQVLVLQYERCVADPVGEFHRTLEFLAVDSHVHEDMHSLRGRSTSSGKTELWPDILTSLHAAYEPEVLDLVKIVPEIDLELWPNFSHLKASV